MGYAHLSGRPSTGARRYGWHPVADLQITPELQAALTRKLWAVLTCPDHGDHVRLERDDHGLHFVACCGKAGRLAAGTAENELAGLSKLPDPN
jgi:hypothetical protein